MENVRIQFRNEMNQNSIGIRSQNQINKKQNDQIEGKGLYSDKAFIFFLLLYYFIYQLKIIGLQTQDLQSALSKQYLQYINMKNIILFLALACLVLSDDVILQSESDDIDTTINSPRFRSIIDPDVQIKRDQAPDAKYLFIEKPTPLNQQYKSPHPDVPNSLPFGMRVVRFTKQFYADCLNTMKLQVWCNAQFYIIVNGKIVFSGNSWKLYTFTFIPTCGLNTFTMIIFYNGPIRLWYALTQNTSGCYNCPDSQRWNPFNCSCECKKPCCTSGQYFKPFPVCACYCKCQQKKQCDKKHYWDENSCSCQCRRPIVCPKGWKQSQTTCQCVKCVPIFCGKPRYWSEEKCACVSDLFPESFVIDDILAIGD